MLRNATEIMGFSLAAQDGEIGRVKDIYFEDEHWTVRYLVADTGKWLPLRKVVISPYAVRGFNESNKDVRVHLTKDQVKNSPSIEEHMPISRQYEQEYYKYYGWPYYWTGPAVWGPVPTPVWMPGVAKQDPGPAPRPRQQAESHLRSMAEVKGYHINARNGEIGHIEDLLFDEETWTIHYLVVDTRNWLPGKKVLLPPTWGTAFDWERSAVHVDLDRETIQNAPEYDSSAPLTREYETRLFAHYNRPAYWDRRLAA